MTRRFPGSYLNFDSPSEPVPPERYAPSLELRVEWQGNEVVIDFLIYTGAESSILYPRQAERLFGRALEQLDFHQSGGGERVVGIDGLTSFVIRAPVAMTFYDEFDTPMPFDATILVVQPDPPNLDDPDKGRGNWDTPSLLGRDLLLHFDLHVSGSRGEVYLSRPD